MKLPTIFFQAKKFYKILSTTFIVVILLILSSYLLFVLYYLVDSSSNSALKIDVNNMDNENDKNKEPSVVTYPLSGGKYQSIIYSNFVSAGPLDPGNSNLIDPYVYASFLSTLYGSTIGSTAINASEAIVGSTHGVGLRGYLHFSFTDFPRDANITKIDLNYFVFSTNLNANNYTEFRKVDGSPTIFYGNEREAYNNISKGGAERSYGIVSGTDVSTTGWKMITLNSNAISEFQNWTLTSNSIQFGIGINSSAAEIGLPSSGDLNFVIPSNITRPFLNITYTYNKNSTINLTGATINKVYAGTVDSSGNIDNTSGNLLIGTPYGGNQRVGWITFNTSEIPDSSNITDVIIRYNVTSIYAGTDWWNYPSALEFQSFNGTCIYSDSHNTTQATNLYNYIRTTLSTTNPLYNSGQGLGVGLVDNNLWGVGFQYQQSGPIQLKQNLTQDCFSIAIRRFVASDNKAINISSPLSGNFIPELHVNYWDECSPPPSGGNWNVNISCNVYMNKTVISNLTVNDAGTINLTANITFSGTNQYIFVRKNGKIMINKGASII